MGPHYFDSSFQNEFSYFPYLVIYMLLLYCLLSIFCGYFFNHKLKYTPNKDVEVVRPGEESCCRLCCIYLYKMFCCCCCGWRKICCCCFYLTRPLLYFDATYESHWAIIGVLLLWLFRLLSLGFVVYLDLYKEAVDEGRRAGYPFINWVNASVAVYFLAASLNSAWGLKTRILYDNGDDDRVVWPIWWERFGALSLVLYEIAAGNTIFILIIQFVFVSHETNFEQIKLYLVPTATLFIELLLNTLPCRMEHYGYVALLPMAYLVCQWVTVYMQELPWEYSRLQTERATCFRVYSILVGIHIGSYAFFSFCHALRDRIFQTHYADRHRYDGDDESESEDEHDVEVGTRETPVANAVPTGPPVRNSQRPLPPNPTVTPAAQPAPPQRQVIFGPASAPPLDDDYPLVDPYEARQAARTNSNNTAVVRGNQRQGRF